MSDENPESKDNGPASDPEGSVKTTETTPTKAEAEALHMLAKGKPDEPTKNHRHDHGGAPHAHDDHGLAHTMPIPLLFGVLGALLVLTIATVSVTSIDLGHTGNLVVAMVIATIKAALVCTFFMHLFWDKKFHTVLFLTSVLFLILFLSMATADRGEYQHLVDEYRAQQLQVK